MIPEEIRVRLKESIERIYGRLYKDDTESKEQAINERMSIWENRYAENRQEVISETSNPA